jgi:hypothetical protein
MAFAKHTMNPLRNSKTMINNPVNAYADAMLNDAFHNGISIVPVKHKEADLSYTFKKGIIGNLKKN